MRFSKIYIYDELSIPELKLDSLVEFLQKTFHVPVEKRKNIFAGCGQNTAHDIAATRIFNYRQKFQRHEPTPEEIQFEMESFADSAKTENIILYDGFEFHKIVSGLIPDREATLDNFHLIFTNKLTCTFDDSDFRYHGRALIGANPAIISTTGIIEAPAKSREYYMDMMANYGMGLNIDSIKEKYMGQYLEYHDPRLDKIIQGYALQAVFYYITGDPFCEFLDCRLNNAHWQRDLLYSQLEFGKLCPKHQKAVDDWLTLN
ncbi:DUF6775 family putative metallopeptidase [Candidatus Nitrosotenuis aquarius]|uniref:DUF6775 family putative metallopeptidase n=1 Tax=Candidatus Nitrosotenuis aquarius TaxID=1846278 RepID=UPI0015AED756|nr:DUF6775 family putative metallopeptidase [Candidatus Nitrosotenuis aquarius]